MNDGFYCNLLNFKGYGLSRVEVDFCRLLSVLEKTRGEGGVEVIVRCFTISISNVQNLLDSKASDLVAAFVAALVILGRFLSVILVFNYCVYEQLILNNILI